MHANYLVPGSRTDFSNMLNETQVEYPLDVLALHRMLKENDNAIGDLKICLSRTVNDFQKLQNQKYPDKLVANTTSEAEIQKLFPMLTPNQISLMTKRKKQVQWTVDEIANGFIHSYFGKWVYNFTIHNMGIPQPSIRTLHRWAENMKIAPGILEDSFVVLDGLSKKLGEAERQVIVSFDEMACKSLYQYNKSLDLIMGPHKHMQTVMVRGLFSRFKQPIYIGFDENMTPDLLMSICSKLYEVNMTVVGSVCDNGGSNVGLWTNSDIHYKNFTINHPNTNSLIFMFSDNPHLLKLLRNWFIEGGFVLEDGTKLDQRLIRVLVEENPEISSIFRISLKHLTVAGTERQNVRLASELFSHTVAQALLKRFPADENAKKLAKFIELMVNNWFDIMNSYSMNGIAYKKPYGLTLPEQNAVLDEMYSTIEGMRCLNKKKKLLKSLQIFQKGILMSISSIKRLQTEMEEKFGKEFMLTHRTNQDCLENFFSQMRYRNGPNDHPTPVECIYNIKQIILGKNPGIAKHLKTNTIEREVEEYASASFLQLLRDGEQNPLECEHNAQDTQQFDDHLQTNSDCVYDVDDAPIQFLEDSPDHVPEYLIDDYDGEDDQEVLEEEETNCTTIKLEIELIESNIMEEDGLEYIADWMAFKLKDKEPQYSKSRRESLPSHVTDHTYSKKTVFSSSWIDALSYGGLTKPSDRLIEWAPHTVSTER